jgi:acyl-CoA thioesterase
VLREGRAVTSAQCVVRCGAAVAAHVVGVYGAARPSSVQLALPNVESGAAAERIPEAPMPPGVPRFIRHFEMRWVEGPGLFSGKRSRTRAYLRHNDPRAATESHVIALTDALPPPALSMCTAPVPASSLVWTLEFLAHDFSFPQGAWWRIDQDLDAGGEGYAHESGILYAPDGSPMALTRQLVTVFD